MTRVDWDMYFIDMAKVVSKRTTCLRRRWGSVLVDRDHQVVSTGYCGMPAGQEDCLQRGVCNRDLNGVERDSGNYFVCYSSHSEANALLQAGKKAMGCTLYLYGEDAETCEPTTHKSSCFGCSKLLLNAGVNVVVQLKDNGMLQYRTPKELFVLACTDLEIPVPGDAYWCVQKHLDFIDNDNQRKFEFMDNES